MSFIDDHLGFCYFCIFVNFENQNRILHGSRLIRADNSAVLVSLRSLQRPCSILMASSCNWVILVRLVGLAPVDCIQFMMTCLFNWNPFLRPLLVLTGSEINIKHVHINKSFPLKLTNSLLSTVPTALYNHLGAAQVITITK
jgi:hypothetical protein